ncbi:hypothetical protein L6452_11569 [Arctium lappa]|uniref:Uncharacterized protein n=1 Tax=Arctium lappa TaxID=4217 RepID=A0ACB9DP52_ARCLA|nr:hypothetical protein L6452_11569 [Arctium lappa]
MAISSFFFFFLFPPPSSLFVTAMSILNSVALITAGYTEMNGKNKQYAKFFDAANSSRKPKDHKLASRNGMLLFYTPSFLLGLASFAILPLQDPRFFMLVLVLTLHFFKRILEVLFVHKFSGFMMLNAATTIGSSYAVSTATMIYSQYLCQEFAEPSVDLKYVGVGMFLVGISGNFYHHYLLSNLRKKGEREYKIPKGGLFALVICPHYLFEVIGFIGVACISQTPYAFSFAFGTTFLLMGRSHATRKWYLSKFGEDFHKDIKALIPYLF